jgi:hypothetical protein
MLRSHAPGGRKAGLSKAITLRENLGLVRRERHEGRRERFAADDEA